MRQKENQEGGSRCLKESDHDQCCQLLLVGQEIGDWDLTTGVNSAEVGCDFDKHLTGVGLEYVEDRIRELKVSIDYSFGEFM